MKPYLLFLSFLIGFNWSTMAQNGTQTKDSLINYTDINGRKHGKWTKKYKSGKVAYEAFFKNDKLFGNYKRYYVSGKILMEVSYDEQESGYAKHYYDDGVLSAEGQYVKKNVKQGLWKYYGVDGILLKTINYQNGTHQGRTTTYWRNGKIAEEIDFVNDQMEGLWAQYFENGGTKMKCKMVSDKRNGLFYVNHPNGKLYMKGYYKDNLKIGPWEFYDDKGTVTRSTTFENGVAADQDQIDAETTKTILEYEEMKGKIPDPNEENMFNYQQLYGPISK